MVCLEIFFTRERLEDDVQLEMRSLGVAVEEPLALAGGSSFLAREVRRLLGAGILAKVLLEQLEALKLPVALFHGVTGEEADLLEAAGARRWKGERPDVSDGPVLRARCMGSLHRLKVVRGMVMALDHSEEEIALLQSVGEPSAYCAWHHGRMPAELVAPGLSGPSAKWLELWLKRQSMAEAWYRKRSNQKEEWVEIVISPTFFSHPHVVVARTRRVPKDWPGDLEEVAAGVADDILAREVRWSRVAPVVCALVAGRERPEIDTDDPQRKLLRRP